MSNSGLPCGEDIVTMCQAVSTHLLIHLSARLCHHHHSHHPSLSFTLSLQAQNLSLQQILPILILLLAWTAFTITGPDRTGLTMLLVLFLVRFALIFLFVPCGKLSWLHVSILLHVKCSLSYRIISYNIVTWRTDGLTDRLLLYINIARQHNDAL